MITIMIATLILMVEVNKQSSQIKQITYNNVTWFFYVQILQIKNKHPIVPTKSKELPNSDISGKKRLSSLFMAIAYDILIGYSDIVYFSLKTKN